ncbi:MAG TPA: FTR1 family protein [Haliangiales bacterium]|nr:FTR1 family protein [Haliangiales bacterium]
MRRFLFAFVVFGAGLAACAGPPAPPPSAGDVEAVRRLAAILDYVAADYGGTVKDGAILDATEYQEQLSFLRDAKDLARKLPQSADETAAAVEALEALVHDRAPGDKLGEAARALRRTLLDRTGLVLAPSAPPSRARAATIFAAVCSTCHGASGGGDGPAAATLNPRPRSFLDPATVAQLSPARAFNALTDGVKGTGMASFGGLPAGDRWSLAFYVLGLRHDPAAVARGESAFARAGRPFAATPTRLAGMSDGDILAQVPADALAWLRGAAPYVQTGAPLDAARRSLAAGVAAYKSGDRVEARRLAGAAYLDGFEPHEGSLRAHDAGFVSLTEERFLALREKMSSGASADEVEREALQIGALFDRAEEILSGKGGARVAFLGAVVVVLREGVEAALLILLLLGLARRSENGAASARAVHWGWLAAVGVGLVTWFLSEPLMALGGARRELMEGIVALLATVVLLLTGHFVLARIDAKHRVEAIKRRLAAAGARRKAALAGLAFVAVYREAFEVVLFLRAIILDASASGWAVAAGVGAGMLVLVGIVWLLMRLGRRLKTGPLLATMGTLLCVLAFVLAGKGIRSLQEAGAVGITPIPAPRIDWLGVFPTLQSVGAQLIVLVAFVVVAMIAVARRQPEPA